MALEGKRKADYERESELIRENKKKPEAIAQHKFKGAEWTHPNGHPRCLVCGDEERTGGVCNKGAATIQSLDLDKHGEPEVKYVNIGDIQPNPWNRKLERAKLDSIKAQIRDTGQLMPLVITEVDKRGKKVLAVTDGHHRLAALKEMGHDGTIPVVMADERGTKTAKDMTPKKIKRTVKKSADIMRDLAGHLNKGDNSFEPSLIADGPEREDVEPSRPLKKPYEKSRKSVEMVRDLVSKLNCLGLTKVAEMAVEGLGLVREDLGIRRPKRRKDDDRD
jgi:hypothetical protein